MNPLRRRATSPDAAMANTQAHSTASPEVEKELLHLRYLTVRLLLSFKFVDLGLLVQR